MKSGMYIIEFFVTRRKFLFIQTTEYYRWPILFDDYGKAEFNIENHWKMIITEMNIKGNYEVDKRVTYLYPPQ